MAEQQAATVPPQIRRKWGDTYDPLRRQINNGTRMHLQDVFLHNYAESKEIERAAQAKGYGLNPREYVRPFPGTSVVINQTSADTTTPVQQVKEAAVNWWKRGVIGLVTSAALTGGGLGAASYFRAAETKVQTLAPQTFKVGWNIDPETGKVETKQERIK